MTDDPCADLSLLIQAELDGELDAAAAAKLAGHLRRCPACTTLRADLVALSTSLRGVTRHTASPALRRAIAGQRPVARRLSWTHAAAFGAGLAVAAAIATFIILPQPSTPSGDLVSAHIRALQPGHLMDVVSSDQHTVKPWFDGRLDFAPPVKDFATQGFPLIGGRLDYLNGHQVAALIYRRDKHLIDLFIWPGNTPGRAAEVQGYNVTSWTQSGMNFRAVSDLNRTELDELATLVRAEN